MDKELEAWYKLHQFYFYSGYATKDLAAYLGVSARTIQRWIQEKTKPSKEKLLLIKRYLESQGVKKSSI